jgi:hypothetical protein
MKKAKTRAIVVVCLLLGCMAIPSLAQQAPDSLPTVEADAGVELVVASVRGPATAFVNETISLTYTVRNKGDAPSDPYSVGLYLSSSQAVDPAAARLLKEVTFSAGLTPGQSKETTSKVVVPVNLFPGKYYYGAVVASSRKASSKQVYIARYSTDNNDTVTDHKTGLLWQRADDGQTRNWRVAKEYCEDLVLGGYDDWRLPLINELETIVDYSRYGPSIDPAFSCSLGSYWSCSTLASHPDVAWLGGFYYGYATWDFKSFDTYARCVRGVPW